MPATPKRTLAETRAFEEVQALSAEAFNIARAFAGGDATETAKQRARDLRARLPSVTAGAEKAPPSMRPEANRLLSEARLDLDYVIAGGGRPTSIRLARVGAGAPPPGRRRARAL